jgi:hypothetical protein
MLDYQLLGIGNRGRPSKQKTLSEEPQQALGPNGLM